MATAASDLDLKRSRHRLNLLALSSINEAFALTNQSRIRARDILQVNTIQVLLLIWMEADKYDYVRKIVRIRQTGIK